MSMALHPAKQLFRELFAKAASVDNPVLPEYFVPRFYFHDQCRKAGIPCPEGFIASLEWENELGMRDFVKREIKKWRRKHTKK